MFSVKEPTAAVSVADQVVIDKFFDSLQWDIVDRNPIAPVIPFADLMDLFDLKKNERWAYTGSLTRPPCSEYVFWNVIKTVFPIKQRHVQEFRRKQLERNEYYWNPPKLETDIVGIYNNEIKVKVVGKKISIY